MPEFLAATPELPVADLSAAVAFYRDKLRFEVVAEDVGFALLERDQILLQLWLSGDLSWKQRSHGGPPIVSGAESFLAGTASCRMLVRGISDLYTACKDYGIVHPNGHLKTMDYGANEFVVLDLDGNAISFYEFVSQAN